MQGTPAGGRRALIVDDHEGFRTLARRMLESAGFSVSDVATGTEAVAAAATVRPALVLLDVQLPDLDGFEVARVLAQRAPAPVVVLTSARDALDFGGRVERAPVAGFLPKDQLNGSSLRNFLEAARP